MTQLNPISPAGLVNALQKDGICIEVRQSDGFVNATRMAKDGGREWSEYFRLASTKAFLEELSKSLGRQGGYDYWACQNY